MYLCILKKIYIKGPLTYFNPSVTDMSYSTAVKEGGGGEEENKNNKSWNDIMDDEGGEETKFGNSLTATAAVTNEEIKLLTTIKSYVNTFYHSERGNEEREFYLTLRTYINQIINDNKNDNNYPYKKKNVIELEFRSNKTIIVKGDKGRYGLIVGPKGATLNKLAYKYNNVKIDIPSRNVISNEISVQGDDALTVVCEIIERIKP